MITSPAPTSVFLFRACAVALALPLAASPASAQDGAHAGVEAEQRDAAATVVEGVDFRVYDRAGQTSSLEEILRAVARSEVLLVGEEHDDMPGHALEALLFERVLDPALSAARPVVLSLEMFERDVQYVVDEYLDDLITEAHFLRSARPWDDYETRYRPLVEAAKAADAPVVAANAPRRYVNRVTREGPSSLAALPEGARRYLPPLPYPAPSEPYREQWNALMADAMAEANVPVDASQADEPRHDPAPEPEGRHGTGPSYALDAQALWDASMGHAITTALVEHLDGLVVHFAGSFHVERGTGIPERIQDYRPGTRVRTVVITKADALDAWSDEDHLDIADFVVLTLQPDDGDEGSVRER